MFPLRPVQTLHRSLQPLRVDVDLVLVPVTVTNANNQLMTNLDEPRFEVYENNERQEIRPERTKLSRA